MIKHLKIFLLICGSAFGLAALPVFGQEVANRIEERGINKQPIRDFVKFVKEKNVDLTKPFLIEFDGVLTKNGKPDEKTSKFIRTEGDEEMLEIAKRGLQAFFDSGWFGYLSNLKVEKFNLVFEQNENDFYAVLRFEQINSNRARTTVSALNSLIMVTKASLKEKYTEKYMAEKALWDGFKVVAEEKNVIINFSMPKDALHEIIRRELNESDKANQ